MKEIASLKTELWKFQIIGKAWLQLFKKCGGDNELQCKYSWKEGQEYHLEQTNLPELREKGLKKKKGKDGQKEFSEPDFLFLS